VTRASARRAADAEIGNLDELALKYPAVAAELRGGAAAS
jgi:hypothetical protein